MVTVWNMQRLHHGNCNRCSQELSWPDTGKFVGTIDDEPTGIDEDGWPEFKDWNLVHHSCLTAEEVAAIKKMSVDLGFEYFE